MLHVLLLIICVFSTLKTSSLEVTEINPPRLIPDVRQNQVNAGDMFELVCECDRPINWIYPKINYMANAEEYGVTHSVVTVEYSTTSNGEHHSVLRMTNSTYKDTGYYSCVVNGTTDINAWENTTQIYMFVKDQDHLFVSDDMFKVQEAKQHETAIIPCRPTSLDVNVTLSKDSEMIPLGAWNDGAINVTFDPTIGFSLKPVNTMDSGVYECVATMDGEPQSLYCQLNVLRTTYSIPKPSINESNIHAVVVGDTLYLECLARVSRNIRFYVNWTTPNREIIKSGRVITGEIEFLNTENSTTYLTAKKSLQINNVTLEDAGNYTCQVTGHNGNSNTDTKLINVLESTREDGSNRTETID